MSRSDYASRYVKKRKRSIVTEIAVCTAGMGLLLFVLAGGVWNSLGTRDLFLGIPVVYVLAFLGALTGIPGALLLVLRSKLMIWLCVVCASIPALWCLAWWAPVYKKYSTVQPRDAGEVFILLAVPVLLLAVPVTLVKRGLKANQELDAAATACDNEQ